MFVKYPLLLMRQCGSGKPFLVTPTIFGSRSRDHFCCWHKREVPRCQLYVRSLGTSGSDAEGLIYRPTPEPGVGVNVEPLGEGLIRLFPDGFRPLFAPAAALPAPLPRPPFAPLVEVPVVIPFVDDPVVVPLAAGPPAAELPPAEPLPLCATIANPLDRPVSDGVWQWAIFLPRLPHHSHRRLHSLLPAASG
jgi:hypothetical protein